MIWIKTKRLRRLRKHWDIFSDQKVLDKHFGVARGAIVHEHIDTFVFLKHGAALLSDEKNNYSALSTIFRLNKDRLLERIIRSFPDACDLCDGQGNSLLHFAAAYSTDSEFIPLILKSCPELSVNTLDNSGLTAFDMSLDLNVREEMMIALISGGADIFRVSRGRNRYSLEIIMFENKEKVFSFILKVFSEESDIAALKKIFQIICDLKWWNWMDCVLEVHPNIPVDWFDLRQLSFMGLILHNAWRTFRYFLEQTRPEKIPTENLLKMIEFGSKEFLQVSSEFGADFGAISEKIRQDLLKTGEIEMYNLIRDLSNRPQ